MKKAGESNRAKRENIAKTGRHTHTHTHTHTESTKTKRLQTLLFLPLFQDALRFAGVAEEVFFVLGEEEKIEKRKINKSISYYKKEKNNKNLHKPSTKKQRRFSFAFLFSFIHNTYQKT